jgi:hypothetical protein
MRIELDGGDKLLRLFDKTKGTPLAQALSQALYMTGHEVLNRSKELVPVDFGILRDSGQVHNPKVSADRVEVQISYGGAAAPYALIVHEDMRPKNWSKPGTGPKYLEKAVTEFAPKFIRLVQERFVAYSRRV